MSSNAIERLGFRNGFNEQDSLVRIRICETQGETVTSACVVSFGKRHLGVAELGMVLTSSESTPSWEQEGDVDGGTLSLASFVLNFDNVSSGFDDTPLPLLAVLERSRDTQLSSLADMEDSANPVAVDAHEDRDGSRRAVAIVDGSGLELVPGLLSLKRAVEAESCGGGVAGRKRGLAMLGKSASP